MLDCRAKSRRSAAAGGCDGRTHDPWHATGGIRGAAAGQQRGGGGDGIGRRPAACGGRRLRRSGFRRLTRTVPDSLPLRIRLALLCVGIVALCACGAGAGSPAPASLSSLATTTSPTEITSSRTVVEPVPFLLNTHCGIREAFANQFFLADPVLDDGSGNPPPGWGNPTQPGTMSLLADGRAVFRDESGHEVFFQPRPGADSFLDTCI